VLVHYSAAPYVIFLAGHHVWMVLRQRHPDILLQLVRPAVLPGVLLAVWLLWSLATYGPHITFASNTTATAPFSLGNVWVNTMATLTPHFLRESATQFQQMFAQSSLQGLVRDYFFLVFQTNLLAAVGSVGGVAAICCLTLACRPNVKAPRVTARARFFLAFSLCSVALAITVNPGRELFGAAHVCLQPLAMMGVALLATYWSTLALRWRLRWMLSLTVDFALGVFLNFRVQFQLADQSGVLSAAAHANWVAKQQAHVSFLGDHMADWSLGVQMVIAAFYFALLLINLPFPWQVRISAEAGAIHSGRH
jgi:hypothetical protein